GDDGGWANCDAAGSRIGVTWNQDNGVYYAEYNTGSNLFTRAAKNVYALSDGTHAASYSGAVALSGATTVGIAAPLCVQNGCDWTRNLTRIDLNWLESADGGGTWSAPTL